MLTNTASHNRRRNIPSTDLSNLLSQTGLFSLTSLKTTATITEIPILIINGFVAMELDLGGLETIDNPSMEIVRHHLKYMPVESRFVILSNGDSFIQAMYDGERYQVEHKEFDSQQNFCYADYEKACTLFNSFHSGRDDHKTDADWKLLKPQTVWNTPYHPVVLIILCGLGLVGIVFMIWNAFN